MSNVLDCIVQLVRSSANRKITEDRVCGNVVVSSKSLQLLQAISDNKNQLIRVLEVDSHEVDVEDLHTGQQLRFDIKVPSSAADRFYQNAKEFITKCSLISCGKLPTTFYLIDEDLLYPNEKHNTFNQLKNVCTFVGCLEKLALYHDSKNLDQKNKLVFLNYKEGATPVVLSAQFTEDMLEAVLTELTVIESLALEEAKYDVHYSAKMGVFVNTLSDVLANQKTEESAFYYLIHNWNTFVVTFNNNLNTFLSGFAFHKAKKEVIEESLKISNEVSKIPSEITGKLFALPVSVAAAIPIVTGKVDLSGDIFIVTGLLFTSYFLHGLVKTQCYKYDLANQAKNLFQDAIDGKKEQYPNDLQEHIVKTNKAIDIQFKDCNKSLDNFKRLSWVPAITGVLSLITKYLIP